MASHAHGWSDLPADVLATVFDGLSIRALIRAGAVCRWWNAASSYVQTHHRVPSHRQTPCLLYKSTSSSNSDTATLYSITDRRSYTVPFSTGANIPGNFWLGASHGWLVTADDHAKIRIVNPVTGQWIDTLPPVSGIEQVRLVHDVDSRSDVVADRYQVYPYDWSLRVDELTNPPFTVDERRLAKYLYFRAFLSSDPSDGDCVVVLLHRPDNQLSFVRPGDERWTWIRTPPENTEYCDCAFDDGDGRTLYAMRHDGAIHAFDLHGRPLLDREVILRPQVQVKNKTTNYLLHAPWLCGWIQVWRTMESTDPAAATAVAGDEPYGDVWKTESIKVYQVDLAAQTLIEINDLGDHALFVGCNHSFSLTVSDCPGILPNHVYYTDNEEFYALYMPQCPRDIGVYNVGDGSFHDIQPSCTLSNWPLPSWIMPTLAHKRE